VAGVMGLGERLDAVRREASASGVTVVVDLHGKLVDLSFTREALTLRPAALAGVIRELTLGIRARDRRARVRRAVPGQLPGGAGVPG